MNPQEFKFSVKTQPIRLKFPLIASFPWKTSVLNVDNLASIFEDSDTCFKEFSEKLMVFENVISSASTGHGLALRQFLGFQRDYIHLRHLPIQVNTGVLTSSLSAKNKSALNMLLVAYRIVDIAAAPKSHLEQPLTYEKTSDFGGSIQHFDFLHDWPNLLYNFTRAVFQPMATIANNNNTASLNNETASLNRHFKVLESLIRRKGALTILINVQLAVISLHRMMTGAQIDQTDIEVMQYLEKFCRGSDKSELPLRLALFISPLYLLIPKSLHNMKGRIDVCEIMETAKCLGNRRPPTLLRVERELITLLFRLATQEVDLITEVKDCLGRMPWEDINAINKDSEAFWFKGANIVDSAKSAASNLHDAEQPVAITGPAATVTPSTFQMDEMNVDGNRIHTQDTSRGNEDVLNMGIYDETQLSKSQLRPLRPNLKPEGPEAGPSEKSLGKRPQQQVQLSPGSEDRHSYMDIDEREVIQHSNLQPRARMLKGPEDDPSEKSIRVHLQQQVQPPGGEEENMDVDDSTRDYRLRPPTKKTLGKRKDVPITYVSSAKKSKVNRVQDQPRSTELSKANSLNEFIDLDKLFGVRPSTLDVKDLPKKYKGNKIRGYDPSGAVYEFTPALHVKEDLSFLEAFNKAINAGFVDGQPLHIADPEKSAFRVMTVSDFEEKPVEEVQEILRQKHIIVTNMQSAPLKFDSRGLSTLTGLSTVADIQDQSIGRDPVTLEYPENRLRQGSVRSFLVSSQKDGKILNSLRFRMPEQGLGNLSFSTDSAAWLCTKGAVGCPQREMPPLGDLRWGVAATTGALNWLLLDSNGFGTYIDTKTGLKWWICLRKKGHGHRSESCSEPGVFFGGKYMVNEPNAEQWDLEAVVLTPGTRLIMRPNTPYAVFTPEHSICHGGHFYAISTMQDTMFAIVHTFVSPQALTNTDHPAHGIVLRRIAAFYHAFFVQQQFKDGGCELGHLPKLTEFNSVLDLFTFCNLMIMANVLDLRTYQPAPGASQESASDLWETHDANGIPAKERFEMAYFRGYCWDILCWFFHDYEIFDKETGEPIDGFNLVAMRYLAHQGSAIIGFKRKAHKRKMEYSSQLSVANLVRQMNLCFKSYNDIPAITAAPAPDGVTSLAFQDQEKYAVRRLVCSEPYKSPDNFLKLGTTKADEMFFKYYKSV